MNAGAIVAIMAATAAAKAREEALDAFRLKGATSADRARTLAELGLGENTALRGGLFDAGVVRGVDARGRLLPPETAGASATAFFLDEAALIAERSGGTSAGTAKRIALVIVVALILLLIGIVALLPRAR
jgi:hypothetical protein